MRARIVVAIFTGLLVGAAAAQTPEPRPGHTKEPKRPIFSPPTEGPASAPAPAPAAKPQEAPPSPPPVVDASRGDAVDALIASFQKWPGKQGKDAAIAVSGYGDGAVDRLIALLSHNDWRLQAAAAHALGLMKAARAAPELIRALREPTNGQSLPELAAALGSVDPERGPFELLPLLASPSSRVRDAGAQALPAILDERHLDVLRGLYASSKGPARALILGLFERAPGGVESDEVFAALSDPETPTALAAAKMLGRLASPRGIERVLQSAREGTLRSSAYAMLALVVAEDARGIAPPLEDDALRLRGLKMLRSDDPFYRGAAAIFLANLSYRSDEAALVETANKYLAPTLLDAVAGGVFYSDYAAVAEFAFEKLELISGETLGRDAKKWANWWARAGGTFVARRRLSTLDGDAARLCVAVVQVVSQDGTSRTATFAGDLVRPTEVPSRAILLGQKECDALRSAAAETKFFQGGTDGGVAVDGGFVEIALSVGFRRFERRRAGAAAAELKPFADALFKLDDQNAWQRFAPADPATRLAWIADRRAELDAETPEAREARILDMALAGYATFDREGRDAALRLVAKASPEWRLDRAAGLATWLRAEPTFNDAAATIVSYLSDAATADVRDAVFALADSGASPRLEASLAAYLSARDYATTVAAFKAKSGALRVLGARSLAKFGREPDAAPLLVLGLSDPDSRVREACVASMAKLGDPRTLAMIDAVLEGTDKALRVRAIEALGAAAGDDAAPRLAEIYRTGDAYERTSVVRALERAGGPRARAALHTIAREAADVVSATDAVAALARIGGEDAASRVAALLRDAPSRDVRLQSAGAIAVLLGPDAAPHLEAAAQTDDAALRRVAVLASARVGGRATTPLLLEYLDAPTGDPAAEDAFRRLTFFTLEGRTPRERAASARTFLDAHGASSRAEWFRRALNEEGFDPSPLESRLDEGPLDAEGFGLLLRVLTGGSTAVREAADQLLQLSTGIAAPPLPLDADAAQTAERRRVYEAFAAEEPAALKKGLKPGRRFFDPSPVAESRPK